MKYLRSYNQSINESANPIVEFLKNYCDIDGAIEIDSSGMINVSGSVRIKRRQYSLTKIPVKFGKVRDSFDCTHLGLTTLENCPDEVYGYFDCKINNLQDLKFSPRKVGTFICSENPLTSLDGAPEECVTFKCGRDIRFGGGSWGLKKLQIENLVGGPKKCGEVYISDAPNLTSLEGGPISSRNLFISNAPNLYEVGDMKLADRFNNWEYEDEKRDQKILFLPKGVTNPYGYISPFSAYDEIFNEPLANLMALFENSKDFDDFMETFPCVRGNTINKRIFEMGCIDLGMEMPDEIPGYKFV